MKYVKWFFLALILFGCKDNPSRLELPSLFSSKMVLQQQSDVSFWGWANPGCMINIETGWGQATKAKTTKEGKWTAKISTPDAGGPYNITISCADTTITLENVFLGEVWLCSGQSNMEMSLKGWPPKDTISNFMAEIASANYPEIRLFKVTRALSFIPEEKCQGQWAACSPETAGDMSATAYFFGRELHKNLGVPIGLIQSSWGGTPAESWTSADYLRQMPDFKDAAQKLPASIDGYEKYINWLNQLTTIDISTLPTDSPYKDLDLGDNQLCMPDYDCSGWDTLQLPCFWETGGIGNFDGVIWFRKEFEFPDNLYPEGFQLYLGPVDDMDVTYINGVKIGAIDQEGFWTTERVYNIPESCIRKGTNVIAVKVIDPQGGGGIYGKNIAILKAGKEVVDLKGEWTYKPVALKNGTKLHVFGGDSISYKSMPKLAYPLDAGTPTLIYNAMINPLIPYTLKGAIWYQGEANVGRGVQYRGLFPLMIKNWREVWELGDFPFYYVQIAPYNYDDNGSGATPMLRDAQLRTLKEQNTGMVVTTDIGNTENIHPANKQDVGQRLANWALANTYGMDSIAFSGPIYKSCEMNDGKAVISFMYADNGLTSNNEALSWFEIAGEDTAYVSATATIDGSNVVVWSEKVPQSRFVRFGWSDIAEPNLFNKEGLPASPFITE